jgi:23S rRNA pseudouridine2457 synthase
MTKIIAFNKPFNVHSQFRAENEQITLKNFIDDATLRIAGRLDRDSEGLMLLTDNGNLNQQITHPKSKHFKTYVAQLDGDIDDAAIVQLQQGIELSDGRTLPAKVKKIAEPEWLWQRDPPIRYRANIPTSWIEIEICEGRNRQIRRMTAAVNFPTLRLIRIQIGSVNLLDLGLESGDQRALEPLFYDEFRNLPPLQPATERRSFRHAKPDPSSAKQAGKQSKQDKKRDQLRAEIAKSDGLKPRRLTNGTTRINTKQRGRKSR